MRKEVEEALNFLKEAVASIQANLPTHQQIQNAIKLIEDELRSKQK